MKVLSRRKAIQGLAMLSSIAGSTGYAATRAALGTNRLKISLNAYSFHKPLSEGSMNLHDLLEFCSKHRIDGVDLTGYYFPGYPKVPSDDYLYELKKKAFKLGVDISGTGVRNDFTNPDATARKADIAVIKNWIIAASKIGAPVIRVFSGTMTPPNYDWKTISDWMVEDLRECADFGKAHGVIVAIQNHNDFLKTADQTIDIIQRVNSPWFGLILDIGSFRIGDPYPEIARCIPYAVNWQIKELVYTNNKEEKVNLDKLFTIIRNSSYNGYLPIETLGPGDPFVKIPVFLEEVRTALG
jgi:sugar phosphate isomerase/epimerase